MQVQSLVWEDPLEEEMAAHSNILVRRIPWTEEPGGLWSIGSQKVRHHYRDLAHTPWYHRNLAKPFSGGIEIQCIPESIQ